VLEPEWGAKEIEAEPRTWNIELLQSVEWKRFEELCEVVFSYLNLLARYTQPGYRGRLHHPHLPGQWPENDHQKSTKNRGYVLGLPHLSTLSRQTAEVNL